MLLWQGERPVLLSVRAGGGQGWHSHFYDHKASSPMCPRHQLVGKKASLPQQCCHKLEGKQGHLFHVHNLGSGSFTPALIGLVLLYCSSNAQGLLSCVLQLVEVSDSTSILMTTRPALPLAPGINRHVRVVLLKFLSLKNIVKVC